MNLAMRKDNLAMEPGPPDIQLMATEGDADDGTDPFVLSLALNTEGGFGGKYLLGPRRFLWRFYSLKLSKAQHS